MIVYDKDYTTWLTLICLREDPLSVPLKAKLATRSSQVEFLTILLLSAYADVEIHEPKGSAPAA